MIELLIKQFKLQRKALLLSLVLVGGMFVFGTILHDVILYVDHDPENTVFHLGSLMTIVGLLATAFFYESQEIYLCANLELGMGATRRQFYPSAVLSSLLRYTVVAWVVWVLDLLEGVKLAVFYPNNEVENMFGDTTLTFGIIYGAVLFVAAIGILFGILMLRFGKNVFWVIWALWMATFILGPRGIENLAHTNPEVLEKVAGVVQNQTGLVVFLTGLVLSVIILCGGWISFRTQQVNS